MFIILTSDALVNAGFNSDAWKIGYTLVIFNNYNLKLINFIYYFILNVFNFLKFNFLLSCFIFKNL